MTPEDVCFSLNYACCHPMTWSYVFDAIEKVETGPENTVSVVLKKPTASMLYNNIGLTRIIPEHIWKNVERPKEFKVPEAVIGSGPYRLTQYSKEHGTYGFEAFEGFWGPEQQVQRIEFIPVSEPVLPYENREINLVRISPDLLARFKNDSQHKIVKSPAFWGYRLLFNVDVVASLRDKWVRQAFACSLDLGGTGHKNRPGAAVPGVVKGCPFAPRCVQQNDDCALSIPKFHHVGIERMVACHKGGIENVLTAHGLKKTYQLGERRITAINDVNINVRKGEVVALVGASGSGKSTLAHILVNVLAADTGEVQFAGRPVIEKNATACMGGMQIIFQDPAEAVSHRFKVLDAVREPLDIMLLQDRPHRDRKAIEVMDTMHLPVTPNFLNRTCHTLSGGQRQRLAIARAMITDPVLLVANEITAMLDPSTQAALLRELKGLQHGRGFSMLFITYDIHLARKVSDRVYVLENGRIVKHGASFEVFDHPRAAHTYQLLDAAFDHDRSVGLPINKTKKEKKHATCKI